MGLVETNFVGRHIELIKLECIRDRGLPKKILANVIATNSRYLNIASDTTLSIVKIGDKVHVTNTK